MSDSKAIEDLTFKEGLQELAEIVRSLESNQLELEQSIESYERGVALLGALKARLDNAEQKVSTLMGELDEEPNDNNDAQAS